MRYELGVEDAEHDRYMNEDTVFDDTKSASCLILNPKCSALKLTLSASWLLEKVLCSKLFSVESPVARLMRLGKLVVCPVAARVRETNETASPKVRWDVLDKVIVQGFSSRHPMVRAVRRPPPH